MSYSNKIKALHICPNKLPEVIEIQNTLKSFQKLVNGPIEVSYLLNDEEVCLICNDEGKLNGSSANRVIGYDIIYDNFLIVGDDFKNGDFKSLTNKQIEKYQKLFNEDSIAKTESRLLARELAYAIFTKRS